jgi:hypothetical protein
VTGDFLISPCINLVTTRVAKVDGRKLHTHRVRPRIDEEDDFLESIILFQLNCLAPFLISIHRARRANLERWTFGQISC